MFRSVAQDSQLLELGDGDELCSMGEEGKTSAFYPQSPARTKHSTQGDSSRSGAGPGLLRLTHAEESHAELHLRTMARHSRSTPPVAIARHRYHNVLQRALVVAHAESHLRATAIHARSTPLSAIARHRQLTAYQRALTEEPVRAQGQGPYESAVHR